MRANNILSSPAVSGKNRACYITQTYLDEIYYFKERDYTPQVPAVQSCKKWPVIVRAIPRSGRGVGWGGGKGGGATVVTNDWCIIHWQMWVFRRPNAVT